MEFDERYYSGLKEFPVERLENRAWEAVVVPELGGRVVRFFDRIRGREMLRRASLSDRRYPDTGGIVAAIHEHRHAAAQAVEWRPERSGADQVLLSAALANGLRARHRIVLSERGLHIETTVTNPTAGELAASIQHRAEAALEDVDAAALEYADAQGQPVRRLLIVEGEEPAGRLQLDAPALPRDGWLVAPARFFASFEGASRVAAQWTAKTPAGATFIHWSGEARLGPGAALRLQSFYGRK